ncbi:hypothetical protein [Candidatus Odyssella acanthamoebae]|nr:hypothetical protein [Candidatus Paracaedibacter acanthamoebae]
MIRKGWPSLSDRGGIFVINSVTHNRHIEGIAPSSSIYRTVG